MQYASAKQRICAFWFDTLLIVSVYMILNRIFWQIVPGSEVRADAMQFYTQKDFNNFFVTTTTSLVFVIFYYLALPLTNYEATLGQKIFKIKMAQPDGSKLNLIVLVKRFVLISIKYLMVMLGGPILALYGQNLAVSILALLISILIIVLTSVMAWRNPQGAGPVERLGDYRYFRTDLN